MLRAGALAEMISYRVALRRRGNRWIGLCPFHNEKTPSFHVFQGKDGKGRYHCHGCHKGGDSIDWLRRVEGCSFREAAGVNWKPDPAVAAARTERDRRAVGIASHRDSNPDCGCPDWLLDV